MLKLTYVKSATALQLIIVNSQPSRAVSLARTQIARRDDHGAKVLAIVVADQLASGIALAESEKGSSPTGHDYQWRSPVSRATQDGKVAACQ